MVARKRKRTNT